MNRRSFLQQSAALAGLVCRRPHLGAQKKKPEAMTVKGPIAAEQMGVTLVHEHIFVDFSGADNVLKKRYDPDEIFKITLPHLERLKKLGCSTFVDCTPAYLGRDPVFLKRLAAASGLHILTATGYYGALGRKYLPKFVMDETPEQIAARWLREWKDGIEDTGIRPGLIKVGADPGALHELNRKLLQAAARTHLASGLTIAAHSGNGVAALEALKLVRDAGVAGSAFIWVHAHLEKEKSLHVRAAQQGAWVGFDQLRDAAKFEDHVKCVLSMKAAGHLNRVLLSHDAVGRPLDTLFTKLLPALKKAGLSDDEVKQLTVDSPREAFTIQVRSRK
jgi:predicted metal-dependent phosphotriesterase family hydrolase